MCYKIISNGLIIDACSELNYVRWQERNRLFLTCSQEEADGLISSNGEEIYLLDGGLDVDDLAHVECVEISQEEYEELRKVLINVGTIDADPESQEETDQEEVKKAEWLARLEELEEQNAMLLECLLEMSEVVYGE